MKVASGSTSNNISKAFRPWYGIFRSAVINQLNVGSKIERGQTLSYEDKETYARIVSALGETRRVMSEIEKTIHKHGGWPKAFK